LFGRAAAIVELDHPLGGAYRPPPNFGVAMRVFFALLLLMSGWLR
jgi:hypothetical protein